MIGTNGEGQILSEVKLHTWLANMYNRRFYAAPAQAVFATTPVVLII